ncbi:hypothetical protein MUO79_00890 [Candidatus Bathyarchaeota archaeon]|nr:hypothetical protein [Candidatus Bathyarchaeota archaeon]
MVEDSRGGEEEEEELIININNQSTTNNKPTIANKNKSIIKSFCFPLSKADVLVKFEKIARREKGLRGFSLKLQELIEKHVAAHWAGNEQLLLLHYIDEDALNPHHVLCNYQRGVTREGKIFCVNPSIVPVHEMVMDKGLEGKWVPGVSCYSCKFNRLRKK